MASTQSEFSGEHPRFHEPRYDLGPDEAKELVARLLAEREPSSPESVVCYRLGPDSPYANVARAVEREVFEHYFGNDAEEMQKEYGPYEDQSVFFLSVDRETGEPAGALRAIENGPRGLKTLNDLAAARENGDEAVPHITPDQVQEFHGVESFDDCWDVGTLAVRKPYRATTDTSIQLYRALYVSALNEGINHFISVIDAHSHNKMTGYLGIPFVPLVDSAPFPYLGSKQSHAVYGEVPEFYPKMNRQRYTLKGLLARRALRPLVKGTKDHALQL